MHGPACMLKGKPYIYAWTRLHPEGHELRLFYNGRLWIEFTLGSGSGSGSDKKNTEGAMARNQGLSGTLTPGMWPCAGSSCRASTSSTARMLPRTGSTTRDSCVTRLGLGLGFGLELGFLRDQGAPRQHTVGAHTKPSPDSRYLTGPFGRKQWRDGVQAGLGKQHCMRPGPGSRSHVGTAQGAYSGQEC